MIERLREQIPGLLGAPPQCFEEVRDLREEQGEVAGSAVLPCVWEVAMRSQHFVLERRHLLPPPPELSDLARTSGTFIPPSTISNCSFCARLQRTGSGQCLACQETEYRIIYGLQASDKTSTSLVVAKSNKLEEIEVNWGLLQEHLQPVMQALIEESIKQSSGPSRRPKPRGFLQTNSPARPDSPGPNELVQKELDDFLRLKLVSLIKESSQVQSNLPSSLRESTFRSTFRSFDDCQYVKLRKGL